MNFINNLGIATPSDFSEVGITNGLIRWWPLNGNVNDLTENKGNATNNAIIAAGLDQLCYSFNGSSNYIDLNYGLGFNPTSSLSITLWVKSSNAASNLMFLSSGQAPDSNARLYLATYNGNWDMGIYTNGWGSGSTVAATTAWTFISLIMNGTTAYMYADVQLTKQVAYSSYVLNQNIRLGTHGTDGSYYWNGLIQDVRIYNRALSLEEVKIQYELIKNKVMNIDSTDKLYIAGKLNEVY